MVLVTYFEYNQEPVQPRSKGLSSYEVHWVYNMLIEQNRSTLLQRSYENQKLRLNYSPFKEIRKRWAAFHVNFRFNARAWKASGWEKS